MSLKGGYSILHDSTLGNEKDPTGSSVLKLDNSHFLGGSLGYDFNGRWRAEAEVTHQIFSVDKVSDNATGALVDGSGDITGLGLTLNGFYDFSSADSKFTPYIGAGVGAVYVDADDVTRPGRSTFNDTAYAPTGLAMIGISYDLTKSIPLTTGYRFQWVGVLNGDHTRSNGTQYSIETDHIFIHSVTAGLRFTF